MDGLQGNILYFHCTAAVILLTGLIHHIASASGVTPAMMRVTVVVEGSEWLFSFLQPVALQGGKMTEERKGGERGCIGGGWESGRGYKVLYCPGEHVGGSAVQWGVTHQSTSL